MDEQDYPQAGMDIQKNTLAPQLRTPSIRSRIEMQKKELLKQVETLTRIEKLLDENPAIEEFQNLTSKVRF